MNKLKLILSATAGAAVLVAFFWFGLVQGDAVHSAQLKTQEAYAAAIAAEEEARVSSCQLIGLLTAACYSSDGDACAVLVDEEETYKQNFSADAYNDCMAEQPVVVHEDGSEEIMETEVATPEGGKPAAYEDIAPASNDEGMDTSNPLFFGDGE